MNPWGFLTIALGILLIIMGVKGSYGNVVSAITGKPYSAGTSSPPVAGNVNPTLPKGDQGILGPKGARPL